MFSSQLHVAIGFGMNVWNKREYRAELILCILLCRIARLEGDDWVISVESEAAECSEF